MLNCVKFDWKALLKCAECVLPSGFRYVLAPFGSLRIVRVELSVRHGGDADMAELVAKFAQTITADAYPYLYEHAQQHDEEGPHRNVSAFELALDLIVDGLRKLRDAA